MNTNKHRILAMLLALVMVLSTPLSVFAEGDVSAPDTVEAEAPAEEAAPEAGKESEAPAEEASEADSSEENVPEEGTEEAVSEEEIPEEEAPAQICCITEQPQDAEAYTNEEVVFVVGTTGEVKNYQWQYSKNGSSWYNYSGLYGGRSATLTVKAGSYSKYAYRCEVTFADGTTEISDAAKVVILASSIKEDPKDLTVERGKEAAFTVEINGIIASVQWQVSYNEGRRWKNLSQWVYGSAATLRFTAAKEDNGVLIRAIVSAKDGKRLTSAPAKLTVVKAIKYPAQKFSSDRNVEDAVTVSAPEGAFPEGAEMTVAEVKTADAQAKIDASEYAGADVIAAKDISFAYDGEEIQPKETVTVEMDISDLEGIESLEDIKVYHIADDGEVSKVTLDPASTTETLIFAADGFSTFTITWGGNGGSSNSTTNIRFRESVYYNTVTRGTIVVHYVDENGNPITLPSGIGNNKDYTISSTTSPTVDVVADLAKDITGYQYVKSVVREQQWGSSSYTDHEITDVKATRQSFYGSVYVNAVYSKDGATVISRDNSDWPYTLYDIYIQYKNTSSNKVTIHYGYLDDDEVFHDFDKVPSPTDTPTTSDAFLIYDFDGYQYKESYYRADESTTPKTGATHIQSFLEYNNGWRYHEYSKTYSGTSWQAVGNDSHIYVLYDPKPANTQGGSAQPNEHSTPPGAPTVNKDSTPNGDGTSTLSLSVTGKTTPMDVDKLADVIIVLDVSGSMDDNLSGNTKRITAAKNAINTLAGKLFEKNTDGKELIRISLVTFSTGVDIVRTNTTSLSGLNVGTSTDGISPDGGTNWEAGLETANQMSVESDRTTFIIFVTDGRPTFRMSRMDVTNADLDLLCKTQGNQSYSQLEYYLSDNIFGNGTGDPNTNDLDGNNYQAALRAAKEIKPAGKMFYTIGICNAGSNELANLNSLADAANADGKYTASSASELEAKFTEIANNIAGTLGWSVDMHDGITGMTNLTAKTPVVGIDENSFTYTRKVNGVESPWDPEADGANLASYNAETGAVEWNMGSNFQLENGVTYTVYFVVWPAQQAMDLIADLNNNLISYASLAPDVQKQIEKNGDTYRLKTNTEDAYVSYQLVSKVGDKVTPIGIAQTTPFQTVDPLPLTDESISLKKNWPENMDDYGAGTYASESGREQADEITLTITKDKAVYYHAALTKDNNWTLAANKAIHISAGVMTTETGEDGKKKAYIRSPGHDYTVVEPDEFSYYWDLYTYIYHPMVIDGTKTLLVWDETKKAADVDNINVFEINGKYYRKSTQGESTLEATNERRSNLNLAKVIADPCDVVGTSLFTYKVKINIPNRKDPSNDDYNPNYDDVWFSAWDNAASATVMDMQVSGAGAVMMEDGSWHVHNNEEFTIKIKAGWNIRFFNLLHDTTYEFEETAMPEAFSFKEMTFSAKYDAAGTKDWYTVDGQKVTGSIKLPNSSYQVTYSNNYTTYFYIYHTKDNTVERIVSTDIRVTPGENGEMVFNIVEETKAGTLYGGYYKAYAGAPKTAEEIAALPYNTADVETTYDGTHSGGYWAQDTGERVAAYDGSKVNQFKNANAYRADKGEAPGTAMKPVTGGVYYLKEVPGEYFRPAAYVTYNQMPNKDLKKLYLITVTDDALYQKAGLVAEDNMADIDLGTTTRLYSTFKVTWEDGKEETFKASSVNTKLTRGYLAVWDAASLLEAGTYTYTPYFVTKDGVTVTAFGKRSINITDKLSRNDFTVEDEVIASTYNYSAGE